MTEQFHEDVKQQKQILFEKSKPCIYGLCIDKKIKLT